ncbi:MAG: hypothetical protein MUF34_23025 [Polyangiaceae bacterium]|nr:hypothetical protein [Polyangiaceae bacterium]
MRASCGRTLPLSDAPGGHPGRSVTTALLLAASALSPSLALARGADGPAAEPPATAPLSRSSSAGPAPLSRSSSAGPAPTAFASPTPSLAFAPLAPSLRLGPGSQAAACAVAAPGTTPDALSGHDEATEEDKKYAGLLGPLRPGVMASLAPLPQGLYGIEVGAKYKRWVGAGVQYSTMPTIDIQNVSGGLSTIAVNARFHPFRGGFYVGTSLGRTSIHAQATEMGRSAKADATRTFVTPGIGWLYTMPSGLTIGFLNLGVNVPVAGTLKTEFPPEAAIAVPDLKQRANDVARPISTMVLPSVELLRIGYLL